MKHIAIDTGILGIDHVVQLQPALVVHLLIDTHHFLRIHDVVVIVAGFEARCEFTRVVHTGVTLGASLGGYDNHTAHSASTIDGGGGTVLQDGKRLNVVGVQAGNGTGNQRLRVA